VKDGLEVRFDSPMVQGNQQHVMEYYLLNHPLDCPVCDQAGECWLQDYSFKFGYATSRMVDPKLKNPKKDVGPKTLLYQDRCVMCSRCVRFTSEVSGTGELSIVNRANRCEIDVFPGLPLDNKLQGNVVDICPVGALLDKDFLFKQRVWFLRSTDSICRACSTGCAIHVDHNRNRGWRLRPRFNPGVNDWWMCDEGRFGWKFSLDMNRLRTPRLRRGTHSSTPSWEELPGIIRIRLEEIVARHGPGSIGGQLSPEMSCEEAWLLAGFLRNIDPQAKLALGDVQIQGQDESFPKGRNGDKPRFVIHAEKNPNRRGIEMVLAAIGGSAVSREDFHTAVAGGQVKALWISGGYVTPGWPAKPLVEAAAKAELLIVHDIFPSALTEQAEIVIPSCAWLEREGTFVNDQGKVQPFARAIEPPEGARMDGQFLYELAGHTGLYRAEHVRELMAATMTPVREIHVPPAKPVHQH
jgi:NADH-quinone oxidoreductase subunit G